MRRRLFILLVSLLLPLPLFSQTRFEIPLSKAVLGDSDLTRGFRGLVLSRSASARPNCPAGWSEIETAGIVDSTRFAPVELVRFRDSDGSVQYAVDTSLGRRGTFAVLKWRNDGKWLISDFVVPVRAKAGGDTAVHRVVYQAA